MPECEVCVVGLGYIGLPTATVLAQAGHRVYGCDVNQVAVDTINNGAAHIVEEGLSQVVKSVVDSGALKAFTEPQAADVYILSVPTPFKGDHEPDLKYVEAATRSIAGLLKAGDLVILESTSPVGATESVRDWLADMSVDTDTIYIAHCPERVLPGRIMQELVENDRIVGGLSEAATAKVAAFYHTFVTGKVLETDSRTAELSKLVENSYRDVNIAFANELSVICDKLGMDVWQLIKMANHHPRVNILQPGPGVGGHCIAVDPWFVVDAAPGEAKLIRLARETNNHKPHLVVEKAVELADTKGVKDIAVFGLAYKPNIDDLRESPAMEIVGMLLDKGYAVKAVEPNISALPSQFEGKSVELVDQASALAKAEVLLFLVKHDAFQAIDSAEMAGKLYIDAPGVFQ